jgi:hypothetical protein
LKELDNLDTVIVAASGNQPNAIHDLPTTFLGSGDLPNMIVVGSTDVNCRRARTSGEADWMTTYAP